MLPWSTESSSLRLSDVRDTSLSSLVRDDVLALILNGTLRPGQRINEPDVASRLQVSRVPVREALRSLESSGLVVTRKHAGVFVRQLGPAELQDLYQLRALLDGYAGRCASRLPDTKRGALVQLLQASIAVMQDCAVTTAAPPHQPAPNVQGYYTENLRFHWAIVEAAGNASLSETYRGIVQKLHLSRLKNLAQDLGMRVSIAEHVDIVNALRAGDAEHCETLMAHHVIDALGRLQTSLTE